jgi:hypothetical protein
MGDVEGILAHVKVAGGIVRGVESRWSDPDLRRVARVGVLVGAWIVGVSMVAIKIPWYVHTGQVGIDAHAYWLAGLQAHPYARAPGTVDAFLYSPLFAQAMRPLSLLPWHFFLGMWMVAETVALCWLVRPLPWVWRVPVALLAVDEILMGNIYTFLAVAVVLGMRYPAAWAFPLLTKITPAIPGVVWFVLRGEWRQVVKAGFVTLGLVAFSVFVDPHLWVEWVRFLLSHGEQSVWAWVRLVAGVSIAAVSAKRQYAWGLPLASLVSLPRWAGQPKDMAILLGIPRLVPKVGAVEREIGGGEEPLSETEAGGAPSLTGNSSVT